MIKNENPPDLIDKKFYLIFETFLVFLRPGFIHHAVQGDLELALQPMLVLNIEILLSQPPKYWNYKPICLILNLPLEIVLSVQDYFHIKDTAYNF